MDKICLQGMEFYAYHGVFKEEAKLGQKFVVDVDLYTDLRDAGRSDSINDTLNYVMIYDIVKKTAQLERYNLVEAVAETIADRLLEEFTKASKVNVKVTKVTPPIEGILSGASVEILRERG